VTKVLYVEDNDDNVYMLKMRLELLDDFEVVTAEDGEKGCAMALAEGGDAAAQERPANSRHPDHRALRACARRLPRKGARCRMR